MAATRPSLRECSPRGDGAAITEHRMTTSYGSIVTVHGEVLATEHPMV